MRISKEAFGGKIHIIEMKNNKNSFYDFSTSVQDDKKLLKFAKTILPEHYTYQRQNISTENGKTFQKLIEKIIGVKINTSDDAVYSVQYEKRDYHSILLHCHENTPYLPDKTSIDIRI